MNIEELLSVTIVNVIVMWSAIWMLSKEMRGGKRFRDASCLIFWLVHVAIFWTFVAAHRIGLGYEGPSKLISLWSSVIYLQAGLSVIGYIVIRRKYAGGND